MEIEPSTCPFGHEPKLHRRWINARDVGTRDSLIVYWVGCRRWFGLRKCCTGPEHVISQDWGDLGRREAIRKWNEMVTPGQISGQVLGYWYPHLDQIPAEPPGYGPTGAVLHLRDNEYLDLIQYDDDGWYPLAESGLYTYAHSGSLAHHDDYYFVSMSWSDIYRAELGPSMDLEELADFSKEAARRALPGRLVVVLTLERVS